MAGQDVVCTAQNDALLEGLLTVIHKEREAEFGMSSIQVSLQPAGPERACTEPSLLRRCCTCVCTSHALPASHAHGSSDSAGAHAAAGRNGLLETSAR